MPDRPVVPWKDLTITAGSTGFRLVVQEITGRNERGYPTTMDHEHFFTSAADLLEGIGMALTTEATIQGAGDAA